MKRQHLLWLCLLSNGNPYTDLRHARNSTHAYYQTVINRLTHVCFPTKVGSCHATDKPWITGSQKQRVYMSGEIPQARILGNKVSHDSWSWKLKHGLDQTHSDILDGSTDGNVKTIMGLKTGDNSCMQDVANII